MPRFFRYNYILDGAGSIREKPYKVSVHAVYYCFSKDPIFEVVAASEAWDLYVEITPEWFRVDIGSGYEEVLPGEAKGIGFYYLHVLINDKVAKKIHLRRRLRGKTFFDVAAGIIKRLFRRGF